MTTSKPHILIVDDDEIVFHFIQAAIGDRARLHYSPHGQKLVEFISHTPMDLIFVDLNLPEFSGHTLIESIKTYDESIQIIVISTSDDIDDAIKGFRAGITDFLTKPLDKTTLIHSVTRSLKQNTLIKSHRTLSDRVGSLETKLIIGESAEVEDLHQQIQKLRGSIIDVLIIGESGTGKELVAKSLHLQEQSKNRPYITLNCSAIPRDLIESVLFGHEKGAFTGAVNKQRGKFELAHGGDIFLDEIGTLPFDMQAKLLRVLQEREIEPVGLGHTKKLEFRVIAATNEDLDARIKVKEFRMDLFYRLNKMVLRIPPLRHRKSDIPVLAAFFLEKHARNNKIKILTDPAMDTLQHYDWPGNVRELENVIENLIITSQSNQIDTQHLHHLNLDPTPLTTPTTTPDSDSAGVLAESPLKGITMHFMPALSLASVSGQAEKGYIQYVLDNSASKKETADRLSVDRKTLFRKIKSYDIAE